MRVSRGTCLPFARPRYSNDFSPSLPLRQQPLRAQCGMMRRPLLCSPHDLAAMHAPQCAAAISKALGEAASLCSRAHSLKRSTACNPSWELSRHRLATRTRTNKSWTTQATYLRTTNRERLLGLQRVDVQPHRSLGACRSNAFLALSLDFEALLLMSHTSSILF